MGHRRIWILTLLLLLQAMSAGIWAQSPIGRPFLRTGTNAVPIYATVAATGNVNISNPGTAVFDGITLPAVTGTNGHLRRVFLPFQTTQSQNGLYTWNGSASAMTRTTDADESFDFSPGLEVHVLKGTTYGGASFILTNEDYPTVGTTALTFQNAGASPPTNLSAIQTLSASSTIACGDNTQLRVVPVQGNGSPVTLTSNPQIVAGTHGQFCVLIPATMGAFVDTVTIIDGNGVSLAEGVATFTISETQALWLQYNSTGAVWEQRLTGGGGLTTIPTWQEVMDQGGGAAYRRIGNAISEATAMQVCNDATGACWKFWVDGTGPKLKCEGTGAVPCHHGATLEVNTSWIISAMLGAVEMPLEKINNVGGTTITREFLNAGKPLKTINFKPGALEFDETVGTGCTLPTAGLINSGPKVQYWLCADNDTATTYGDIAMDGSGWDGGPISFTLFANHAVDEDLTCTFDFQAQCVSPFDTPSNTWSAVGADTDVVLVRTAATAGHDANDDWQASTGLITPAGSCQPGDSIYFKMVRVASESGTNCANTKHKSISLHCRLKSLSGADE